ncbi:MAG: lysostaphin resistance A-like protein [Acidimicrobiales bacterium]
MASFALSGVFGSVAYAAVGRDLDHPAVNLAAAIGLWAGLTGAVAVAARAMGAAGIVSAFAVRFRPSDLPLGVAAAAGAQFILLPAIAGLLEPLLGRPEVSGPAQEMLGEVSGISLVLVVLQVVVAAPVVEELFYRGLVLRGLMRRMAVPGAIVSSAVLFALAHQLSLDFKGLMLIWVSLGSLGAVLSVLAVRTGRLGASIVAHAAFNAFTVAFVLLGPS